MLNSENISYKRKDKSTDRSIISIIKYKNVFVYNISLLTLYSLFFSAYINKYACDLLASI